MTYKWSKKKMRDWDYFHPENKWSDMGPYIITYYNWYLGPTLYESWLSPHTIHGSYNSLNNSMAFFWVYPSSHHHGSEKWVPPIVGTFQKQPFSIAWLCEKEYMPFQVSKSSGPLWLSNAIKVQGSTRRTIEHIGEVLNRQNIRTNWPKFRPLHIHKKKHSKQSLDIQNPSNTWWGSVFGTPKIKSLLRGCLGVQIPPQ